MDSRYSLAGAWRPLEDVNDRVEDDDSRNVRLHRHNSNAPTAPIRRPSISQHLATATTPLPVTYTSGVSLPDHHHRPPSPKGPVPSTISPVFANSNLRERSNSGTYYDPVTDLRSIRKPLAPDHQQEQPLTSSKHEVYSHSPATVEADNRHESVYTSPTLRHLAVQHSPLHTSRPRTGSILLPSTMSTHASPGLLPSHLLQSSNGVSILNPESAHSPSETKRADPMSFSSILSNPEPESKPLQPPALPPAPQKGMPSSLMPQSIPENPPLPTIPKQMQSHETPPPSLKPKSKILGSHIINGSSGSIPQQRTAEEEQDILDELAKLDSELLNPSFHDPEFFLNHNELIVARKSHKRKLELAEDEILRRNERRKKYATEILLKLKHHARNGDMRYRDLNVDSAANEVAEQEIENEKERKKDMQRKRRREKTIQNNIEQKEAALAKAKEAADDDEKKKFLREADRAEKKAQQTKQVLARGDKGNPEPIRTVSPLEPNFAGGTMSTFAADSPSEVKSKAKNGRNASSRLKKSKEQKQAEKDSAEKAQALIDAGMELPSLPEVPKIKIKLGISKDTKKDESREATPIITTGPIEPFKSKTYNQIYDQIWKDIARKEVPRVYKMALESHATKVSNSKKTSILASKEAKRWQLRTNKGSKDLQARAKRLMREMMSFWKRNEREERDMRKAAERAEIDNAKKAEADREANRQKRKLNFLISQTELYSHFIGKKIKTDEVERSTDSPDVAVSDAKIAPGDPKAHTIDLPASNVSAARVTNFEDLDFDAEDESVLQAAAAANAQSAIADAQAKARAFNKESAMDDDGEMNFQNPAGMGDVDIKQPTMLQAQLKEYQLKGLNWLANLYEQGINGILADEMGLGKTIQSITVMAYLAEHHGIWGPFMVVAPASTLHNWQQEIARFVPRLKILPYWGTAADRKVLRKFWDRKHPVYTEDAPFHVLITSYQLVVSDAPYFQKMRWQYMILDEAQAIKSSQSSRWKSLLGFHCRNRLLLTGTPIQNNMQELWALLHFIMPSLFDSHDEFSEWFSKDIESHAQSNTKLNEDQLKRLHMILKPFMLRRVKKHVQKELGDKIEIDLFCDLTYRQRAYYANLRNQISIMDLIEKATMGDDNDSSTLMNLVMQFRKVCNHPDLFERAETSSPFSFAFFAESGSFLRQGSPINVVYSTRNLIEYPLPRLLWQGEGRLGIPGLEQSTGTQQKWLRQKLNIWRPTHIRESKAFSWSRFANFSTQEVCNASKRDLLTRIVDLAQHPCRLDLQNAVYDEVPFVPARSMLRIVDRQRHESLAEMTTEGHLAKLLNIASTLFRESGLSRMEQCGRDTVSAPPIEVSCASRSALTERENTLFNVPARRVLYGPNTVEEKALVLSKVPIAMFPIQKMLPAPSSEKQRYTSISVPSMRRFITDSGKLAKLDALLAELKAGGHRVLLYFQMTRMIDLMEEYLTYRNYKYCRLDGSTKLEDRRDTVSDFQSRPEIFIFLLSTRAGGLGINLTSADTVIFYDSDWNPTIDSQAMDRAHRLGQTRQVTVYRMITRGTIEERIRKRALQKEEVQKVVMTGGAGGGVDFNARSKENRTKDIALWLADDQQAELIEAKERELAEAEAKAPSVKIRKNAKKRKAEDKSLEDLYHEGEGNFDGQDSAKASGAATPMESEIPPKKKKKVNSKKAKTAKQRLAMADGNVDGEMED